MINKTKNRGMISNAQRIKNKKVTSEMRKQEAAGKIFKKTNPSKKQVISFVKKQNKVMKKVESSPIKKTITKEGPFISTAKAKKTPGKTVKVGGIQKISPTKVGQKGIAFKKGGLHVSLGIPQGKKIPINKVHSAIAGNFGPQAAKQARFYMNVLMKGQRTARKGK